MNIFINIVSPVFSLGLIFFLIRLDLSINEYM